ncbi:KR domain-containing protein, partial [Saccharothrix sp. ST-888]|uniref:KR domain-containing protein n=1 Tax=Saccharothrix sp. ST-888 TaxID=1427391 RepID=UPI002F405E8F
MLGPRVDAAWNLHLLTRELDLSEFVLSSSAAGVFGNGGYGNYARANSCLDALCARSRAGVSILDGPGEIGAERRQAPPRLYGQSQGLSLATRRSHETGLARRRPTGPSDRRASSAGSRA